MYRVEKSSDSKSNYTLLLETTSYNEAIDKALYTEISMDEECVKVCNLEEPSDEDWDNAVYITVFDTETREIILTSDAYIPT